MTENEARQKWCPFVRQVVLGDDGLSLTTHNRASTVHNATVDDLNCIASDCMAWRFEPGQETGTEHLSGYVPESGYCGLAGK